MTRRFSTLFGCLFALAFLASCHGEVRQTLDASHSKATKKQATACDKGDLHACHNVAITIHQHGPASEEERTLATTLLTRACDGGLDLSCRQLVHYRDANAQPVRDELLLRSCERGDRDACVTLAQRRIDAGEHETGMLELNGLCKKNSIHACIELGRLLFQGDPSVRNPEQAIVILNAPCGGGSPVACRLRSEAQLSLAQSPADITPNIVKQLGEACLAAEERACRVLAGLYDAGVGVEKDPEYALSLLRRACDIPAPTPECNKIIEAPHFEGGSDAHMRESQDSEKIEAPETDDADR